MSWLNPSDLISNYGTWGLGLIVFAETGLLIGFFLPGDSLLFLAGAYCATSASAAIHLNLATTLLAVVIAAAVGSQVGYLIGRRLGPTLFNRPDSRCFKQGNVTRARQVLDQYGPGRALLIGRFVPVVRTLINPVAGVLEVPARVFTMFNLIGAVAWGAGVTLLGYFLGRKIAIDHYILPITAGVIALSLIPLVLEYRKHRRSERHTYS